MSCFFSSSLSRPRCFLRLSPRVIYIYFASPLHYVAFPTTSFCSFLSVVVVVFISTSKLLCLFVYLFLHHPLVGPPHQLKTILTRLTTNQAKKIRDETPVIKSV